jgi:hypothetical protein
VVRLVFRFLFVACLGRVKLTLLLLLPTLVGCQMTSGRNSRNPSDVGVPDWAMHVKPWAVDPALPLDRVKERVSSELAAKELPEAHLAAEQLAYAAIQSLDAGNLADAALWLSLAAHRYRQQLEAVFLRGHEGWKHLRRGVSDSAYAGLLREEAEVYGGLNFDEALKAMGAFLRGEQVYDRDLRERMAELFKEGPVDEESFAEIVRNRTSARSSGAGETLQSPELAQLYLRHLLVAAAQKKDLGAALRAFAVTPLSAFAVEGLHHQPGHVSPRYCAEIANELSAHRQTVAGFLSAADIATRINAAIVVGMNPHDDQLAALEQRWADEKDATVRLALAYALSRHGRRERVGDLTAALAPCPTDACSVAIALLDWLPNELKAALPPGRLTELVSDKRQRLDVRLLAAATLGDLGSLTGLPDASRAALQAMAGEGNKRLLEGSAQALTHDKSWSREKVVAELDGRPGPYLPLLARLTQVVTVEDVPRLVRVMREVVPRQGPEVGLLLKATAHVPGPAMEDALVGWFDSYPHLRRAVAFHLLGRPTLKPTTFTHLEAAREPDVQLLVKLMTHAPDAVSELDRQLREAPPSLRLFAVFLAGIVRDPRNKEALTRLVNFRDNRFYPTDAVMRHAAMNALVAMALTAFAKKQAAQPAPVMTERATRARQPLQSALSSGLEARSLPQGTGG